MKSRTRKLLLLVAAISLASLATYAQTRETPASVVVYAEIPDMPQYIYMGMDRYTVPF